MNKNLNRKIFTSLLILFLLILPLVTASVTLTSDKETYEPGEEVNLVLNYTNTGRFKVTTKYLHIDIKKYRVTAISQTRDQIKELLPEQIETGIHKFTLPFFAPPGEYEIIGYVELENGTLSEEKTITINAEESLLFAIIKWVIIIIFLLVLFSIMIKITKWIRSRPKKPKKKKEEHEELLGMVLKRPKDHEDLHKKEKKQLLQEKTETKIEKQKREEKIKEAEEYLAPPAPEKDEMELTEEEKKDKKFKVIKKPVHKEHPKIKKVHLEPDPDMPTPDEKEKTGKYKKEL